MQPGPGGRCCLALACVLVASGCPRAGGGASTLAASTTAVTQQEMSRGFPHEVKFERCVYTENGETLIERTFDPTLTIDEDKIVWGSSEFVRTEEPGGDVYRSPATEGTVNALAFRLLDNRVYFTSTTGPINGDAFDIQWVCIIGDNDAALRRVGGAWHKDDLRAYNARRAATAKIPADAHDGFRVNLTPAQRERVVRARTMVAFTVRARAINDQTGVWAQATMQLADGTEMVIDVNDDLFDDLFSMLVISGSAPDTVLVQVRADHDESITAEVETAYYFDIERSFVCQGDTGLSGLEARTAYGGVAYHGEPGKPGPDITVVIASTDGVNPDGVPILSYRLTCDDRVEAFRASASSPITVATYGGAGGHAIPHPQGDGANGGDGGDGGDITVIVGPEVEDYTLTTASVGGAGGAASDPDQTNDFTEGSPGARGSEGQVVVRRGTVDLP